MRKTFQNWCLLAGLQTPLLATAADLAVQVGPIKTEQGQVWVNVFKGADSFLKSPVQRLSVVAAGKTVSLHFKDLAPGDYALSVHHDVNGNAKMDRNFIGMPAEPYGFSNDAMGSMGPPSFEQAKLKLDEQGRIVAISLK